MIPVLLIKVMDAGVTYLHFYNQDSILLDFLIKN